MNGLLIVDDEEGIRRSIQAALRREGYPIEMAETGKRAVEIVKKNPGAITIVISDFKMPGMDGIETLAAIGNLNPEICRIILTGYATLESAILATNEGIDGFLTKPFENDDLRHKVREYFIKKSLKRTVTAQTLKEVQDQPTSMVPRRQQLTVLYTNIQDFTAIAHRSDPQDLCSLMTEHYFNPLSETAFHYNGTVDKFIGDSMVVVFGAPVEHQDDARRAVFAALDMREQMGLINQKLAGLHQPLLPLSVSIATWEAVVGLFGSTRKREYSTLGLSVNVAAQLEEMAQAGQILIDETTYAAVRDTVKVEKLAPVQVKGMAQPVQVYNVLGTLKTIG